MLRSMDITISDSFLFDKAISYNDVSLNYNGFILTAYRDFLGQFVVANNEERETMSYVVALEVINFLFLFIRSIRIRVHLHFSLISPLSA